MHSWSGPHGIPGGTERWEYGSYRWRRALEAVLLVVLVAVVAPKVLALAEVVAGGVLMLVGLLWLALSAARPRRLRRRFDVLALLLTVVALVEARRRR